MNSYLEILCRKIGLQGKEATTFMSIAGAGSVTASLIAEMTSLNRATTYYTLDSLLQKGLIYRELRNGKYYYSLNDETALEGYVNKKIFELENAKETITNVFKRLPKRKSLTRDTSAQVFQGEDGVKFAFELAFQAKKKEWDVIAPKNNFLSQTDEAFTERYIQKRSKIKTRTLWELDKNNKAAPPHIIKERNIRYLSNDYRDSFTSLIIIFDHSALFVASYEEQSATLVNSESVISTLRVLFDGAWRSASIPE